MGSSAFFLLALPDFQWVDTLQPQGKCLRHVTECQNLDRVAYGIHTGFDHCDEHSSWFPWPIFSFQVYPGNILKTYHWRAEGANRVVVWLR
jgi:carnitine monooxygenase subunit